MNRGTIPLLLCPECQCGTLLLEEYVVSDMDSDQVIDGCLICQNCKTWYRIENGIADLLPFHLRELNHERFMLRNIRFAEKYGLSLPKRSDVLAANASKEKTKPIGAFEDVENYEKDVVNSRYYKALDETAFLDWMNTNLKNEDLVLDIGCGSGRQCIPMAEAGIRALGLDVDEDMLQLAESKINKRSLSKKVDLLVADGENPPVKDNQFNACVLYGVLHHISQKDFAVINASRKVVSGGLLYSLDPHKSFVRFIFDFLMRIWELYVEEASEDPLITEKQILSWMKMGGVYGQTRLSTYIPPHIFIGTLQANVRLLKITDGFFTHVPGLRKAGGVIIFEGRKI